MRNIWIAIVIISGVVSFCHSDGHALSSLVISHPDSAKHRGDKDVLITISLDNGTSYAGSAFSLSYDSRMLMLSRIEPTDRLSGQSEKGYYEYADGRVATIVFDMTGNVLPADSGAIFSAYFDVKEDSPYGQADIAIFEAAAVVPELAYDTLDVTNGYVLVQEVTSTGGGDDKPPAAPIRFVLGQNYPNPFNPSTKIEYSIEKPCQVKIVIYNVAGQRVRTLVDERKVVGNYSVIWDGRTDRGGQASTGVYFYKIFADKFRSSKKMIMLR